MDRRSFIKICGAIAAAGAMAPCVQRQTQAAELTAFERVKLVDVQGQPIKTSTLINSDAYIEGRPGFAQNFLKINLTI